jgi:hypothetical protein
MRATTIVIPVLFLLGAVAAAQDQGRDSSGRAQTPASPTTTPGGTTVPQAPVGHRQPTQSTLPDSVRKDEQSPGRKVDDLGRIPSICRNC